MGKIFIVLNSYITELFNFITNLRIPNAKVQEDT